MSESETAPLPLRELPDTPLGQLLRQKRAQFIACAERRGASNVRVFGSVARGADSAESDIDLLVDIRDGVSLLDLLGLQRELGDILERRVDVVPARCLKPAIARNALSEAIPL